MLQRSWNKYGKDNFEFLIIEQVCEELLIEREQYYLDTTKCYENTNGYNICRQAYSGDGITSNPNREEIVKKMSESAKKKFAKMTAEEKSGRMKGEKNPNYGIKWSEERRMRMSGSGNGFYGRKHTEETKQRIGQKSLGRKHSEAVKRKCSEILTNFYQTEAGERHKREIGQRCSGNNSPLARFWRTPEARTKFSEIKKQYFANRTIEDCLKMHKVKVVSVFGKLYLGLYFAAAYIGINKGTLASRCKSDKWKDYFFVEKSSLTKEQIESIIWSKQQSEP